MIEMRGSVYLGAAHGFPRDPEVEVADFAFGLVGRRQLFLQAVLVDQTQRAGAIAWRDQGGQTRALALVADAAEDGGGVRAGCDGGHGRGGGRGDLGGRGHGELFAAGVRAGVGGRRAGGVGGEVGAGHDGSLDAGEGLVDHSEGGVGRTGTRGAIVGGHLHCRLSVAF